MKAVVAHATDRFSVADIDPDLYRQKKLDRDRLITRTFTIDEAPEAFADLEKGVNERGVIVY